MPLDYHRCLVLCAALLILGGCQTLLSGPAIIPVYRVTAYETGAIDPVTAGQKNLRIDHPKLAYLRVVGFPGSTKEPARIGVWVTPNEGVAVSLATDLLRVRSCGAASWATASFTTLSGGGSSVRRPALETIRGSTTVIGGKPINASYEIKADLPEKYDCFEVELPDLKVDEAVLRIGRVAFQLHENKIYGYGS